MHRTQTNKSLLSIVFYTGLPEGEPLVNRVTSWLTGRYMHCEIVFTNPDGSNTACGIWQGQTVFFRPKTFGKQCWVWRTLQATASDVQRVRRFCQRQAAQRLPFNKSGLYRCCTPFPRPTDGTCWFCSEMCVAALQTIGYLTDQMPSSITPTHLYALLGRGVASYANASPLTDERIAAQSLRFNFLNQYSKHTPSDQVYRLPPMAAACSAVREDGARTETKP